MTQSPTLSEMENSLSHAMADGAPPSGSGGQKKDMKNPTLSQMNSALSHALAVGEVAPPSKKMISVPDATPRGRGRDVYFDESMIKRDAKGQFASKAELDQKAGDLELTDDEARHLDNLWISDLSKGRFELIKDQTLMDARHAVAQLHGYTGTDMELYDQIKADPRAKAQLDYVIKDVLDKQVGGVSPSGKKRREVYVDYSKGTYATRVVANNGTPHLDINATWALEEYRGRKARIANEAADTTPMFNPKANITSGRVRDLGVNGTTVSNDDMVVINKYINDAIDILGNLGHSGLDDLDTSPKLSEMRHALAQVETGKIDPPTLSEMRHFLENEGDDASLEHFGIKGMKWGIRRSEAVLNRIRGKTPREAAALVNDDSERVGGISTDRKGASALRSMAPGGVVVIDTDDGPSVVAKQKDGSFRKVTISADAQNVLRTVNKQPSEMSTRDLNDAVKRAKAIEEYNKIFLPHNDPNAELKARVEAMELQSKYSNAYRQMNPTRTKKVAGFISDLKPVFDTFNTIDKGLDKAMSKGMKEWYKANISGSKIKVADTTPKADKPKKSKSSSKPQTYNITSLGGGTVTPP